MNLPRYPEHIEWETSTCCQLRCVFCPLKDMKRPNSLMKKEIVYKVVKEIKKEAKGQIRTSYLHRIGEPLLNPDIFEMIDLVASAKIRTSISTNCLLLRERKEEIFKSRLKELTLCLDGITKETYEKYRIGSNFEKVLSNIMDFLTDWSMKKSNIHIQVQLIRMKDNVKEVPKIKEIFSKFKNRGSFEILDKLYSTFGGRVEDLGEGKTPERRHHCPKLWREISIGVDGLVSPCCRDSDNLAVVGDVTKQSIYEIWHGERYKYYRTLFEKKRFEKIPLCRNC
jgi:MoaA/NifB/PqqE/SkfB family radical SAM enzyme